VEVTPSAPVKANSGVRARVPAAGNVLDDQPTLLRDDQHYLHYITIFTHTKLQSTWYNAYTSDEDCHVLFLAVYI